MSETRESKFMIVLVGGNEVDVDNFMENLGSWTTAESGMMVFGIPISEMDFGRLLDNFLDKMIRFGMDKFHLHGEDAEENLRRMMQAKFQSGGKQN